MEIEEGEYCRFKNGNIAKIIEKDTRYLWFDTWIYKESGIPRCELSLCNILDMKFITKHSKNIIDLIEEDDFVNEFIVTKIKENKDGIKYLVDVFNDVIYNGDIETILTHEQYKSNSYKLGD